MQKLQWIKGLYEFPDAAADGPKRHARVFSLLWGVVVAGLTAFILFYVLVARSDDILDRLLIDGATIVLVILIFAFLRQSSIRIKSFQARLGASEARFRAIVENGNDGILFGDAVGTITYRSPSFSRINGYADEERVGRSVFDTVHPEDREGLSRFWARLAESLEATGRIEFRSRHKDGSWLSLEASCKNLLGDPDLGSIVVACRDFTARRVGEAALHHSQALTEAIVNSSPDWIWSVDVGRYGLTTFNEGMREYFLSRRGIDVRLGQSPEDLFPSDDYVRAWRRFYGRAQEEGPYTTEYEVFAGTNIMQLTFHLLKREGKAYGISVFGRDITESKRTEAALRESESRFRALIEQSPVAIAIARAGRMLYGNSVFKKAYGMEDRDTIAGLLAAELFAPGYREEIEERSRRRVLNLPVPKEFEAIALRADGSEFPVSVVVEAVKLPDGDANIIFVTDITERRQAERENQRSLAEKETLLRELYHRTKNNMNTIIALLDIQARLSGDERLKSDFAVAQNRIFSMSLVHEKLYKAQDLSNINLKDYIVDLVSLLSASYDTDMHGIAIALRLESLPLSIDSAIPCGLILNELIVNAIQHAFPEGRAGAISISLNRDEDGLIRLEVRDDGVGLPPGFDLRRDGRLGSKNTFALVESQLDGAVRVESREGLAWHIEFRDDKYRTRV
jgi:PAS domain S-box-containing protein